MKTSTKALSAVAIAGMVAGLTVSQASAAEPGILVKGKSVLAGHGDSCSGKDACDGKDGCDGSDSCSGKDSCDGKDGCNGSE